MFSGHRLFFDILVVIALAVLTVFAFIKFNDQPAETESASESSGVVQLVESSGRLLSFFLNQLSSPEPLFLGRAQKQGREIVKDSFVSPIGNLSLDREELVVEIGESWEESGAEFFDSSVDNFNQLPGEMGQIKTRATESFNFWTSIIDRIFIDWRAAWGDYWEKQENWLKKD